MENILTVRHYNLSKFVKVIAVLSVTLLIVIAGAALLFLFKEFSVHTHYQSLVYVNTTSPVSNSSQPSFHLSNQIIIVVNNSSSNSDLSEVDVTVSDNSHPVDGVTIEASTVEQPTSEVIPTLDDSASVSPDIEHGAAVAENTTSDSAVVIEPVDSPFDHWTPL